MSLITIEEYKEFIEEHPEMEQCYDPDAFTATQEDDFELWFSSYFN